MKSEHTGGVWKVAYADFITAMMALFLVLWISSQSPKIRLEAAAYFKQPLGFIGVEQPHSGVLAGSKNVTPSESGATGDKRGSSGSASVLPVQLAYLNSVADRFRRLLNVDDDPSERLIDVRVTSDGFQVTLFDRAKSPLFRGNGCVFTKWGQFVLQNLSWLIERTGARVGIEGFASSGLKFDRPDYTAWELSIDRANAARRQLLSDAVHPPGIERVVGYGARRPLPGEPPGARANQRIVITVVLSHPALNSGLPATAAVASNLQAPD
ncbi:MAG: flagellar motor protein MotB [Opitutaceae bacterium]